MIPKVEARQLRRPHVLGSILKLLMIIGEKRVQLVAKGGEVVYNLSR
jgi:hypothetical protein